MAETDKSLKDSIVATIQSAQRAVGSAITGGATAVTSSGVSIDLLEDIRSVGKENEKNTQSLLDTMRDMLAFDKEAFRRERDQARELAKEKNLAASNSTMSLPSRSEATGDLGAKGIAALAALAYFAKSLNVDEVLRLPQQIKSIRGMANFAKAIGTIGTAGFGPQIINNLKAAFKSIRLNPKEIKLINVDLLEKFKGMFKPVTNMFEPMRLQLKLFSMEMRAPMQAIGNAIDDGKKMLKPVVDSFKAAFANIKAVFMPLINSVKALFGGGGTVMKSLDTILTPLKTVGKFIGKLFLPITLILGVLDGISGFTKEYGKTGSIVDGIRGAVVGIVDGFIGTFVRLITNLIGMALEYLGLKNLGKYIKELGEKLTGNFSQALGGIVDFVMGIFTLDVGRIWKGLKNVTGGVAGFFLGLITAPIDMAINFIKDIFNFGDPNKPFSLKDFFLGKDGPVMSAWNWFKGLFTFDFESLKQKLFDMGSILKGLGAGGIAAAKAILHGGESPAEAFKRVFDSYTKGNEVEAEPIGGDPIAKSTVQTVKGDVTETTYKTNTINEGAKTQTGNLNVIDQSVKTVNNTSSTKNETYTGKLDTGIDSYHDRNSWAFGA